MKDKEARKEIDNLVRRCNVIEDQADGLCITLGMVSIKECPKCKQRRLVEEHRKSLVLGYSYIEFYLCLTCGSKFTRSEKCVCELLEE